MNLDLLSITHGYLNINLKLAHIVGLKSAAYWEVAVDALHQAKKKNKINDGFFKLDRKYVFEKTTLATPEQKDIERALATIGLLEKNENKADSVALDLTAALNLIQTDDEKVIEKAKAEIESFWANNKKESKEDCISKNLKNKIREVDFELREALFNWVDSLEGKANVKTVEIFENKLNSYTKDKPAKLKILEIATINGYRDVDWAINRFERENNFVSATKLNSGGSKNVATKNDVDFSKTF